MVEEVKGDQPRLQHLKSHELKVIDKMMSSKAYEMEALEDYASMEFDAKNATKYLSTFPYPYMNGFLHMGT